MHSEISSHPFRESKPVIGTANGSIPAKRARFKQTMAMSSTVDEQVVQEQDQDHQPQESPSKKQRMQTQQDAEEVLENLPTSKRGPGRPKGSQKVIKDGMGKIDRQGKTGSISIASKLRIVKRYEELKESGVKKAESWMLKNEPEPGFYQGCLSETKWLGSRTRQGWDAFVEQCPQLAKHANEVPSSFKAALGKPVTGL